MRITRCTISAKGSGDSPILFTRTLLIAVVIRVADKYFFRAWRDPLLPEFVPRALFPPYRKTSGSEKYTAEILLGIFLLELDVSRNSCSSMPYAARRSACPINRCVQNRCNAESIAFWYRQRLSRSDVVVP